MDNLTVTENPLLSSTAKNASVASLENILSCFMPYLTPLTENHNLLFNELLVLVKTAFVCLFIKQIVIRTRWFSMQYDLLLLVICYLSVAGKDFDVCGLSFLWSCYLQFLLFNIYSVVENCCILYLVMVVMLPFAPGYLSLLVFTVDILFMYTMFCYIVVSGRLHNFSLLFIIMTLLICKPNQYAEGLNLITLIYILALPLCGFALGLRDQLNRTAFLSVALANCILKTYLRGVTEYNESS